MDFAAFLDELEKIAEAAGLIDDIESPPPPNVRALFARAGKASSWEDIGGEPVPAYLWKKKAAWDKLAYTLRGHTEFQGLPIAIECRKGDVRTGTDKDGNDWRTKMKHPYGYFVGTKGVDGDAVDVYVGPHKEAPKAFVVHQRKKDTGKYDEDKVMIGFRNKQEARKAFLAHYDSPKFLGPISTLEMDKLRDVLQRRKKTPGKVM